MKKIFFWAFLMFAGCMIAPSFTTSTYAQNGTINISWNFPDGSRANLVGVVSGWDANGPHGEGVLTFIDKNGNSAQINVTFDDRVGINDNDGLGDWLGEH